MSIFAASVDSQENANKVSASLSFPVAWGVEKSIGDQLSAFWDERRNFMQPTEFVINKQGKVLASTYSSSPLGRMDAAETLQVIHYIKASKAG